MGEIGLPLPWGIVPTESTWRPIRVPDPPAGTDWHATVPGGAIWVVQGFSCHYASSAAPGIRRARVSIGDGERERGAVACTNDQVPASGSVKWTGLLGGHPGRNKVGNNRSCGLPYVHLQPGWTFGLVTEGLLAGDTYDSIFLWVTEYDVVGMGRAAARYAAALEAA